MMSPPLLPVPLKVALLLLASPVSSMPAAPLSTEVRTLQAEAAEVGTLQFSEPFTVVLDCGTVPIAPYPSVGACNKCKTKFEAAFGSEFCTSETPVWLMKTHVCVSCADCRPGGAAAAFGFTGCSGVVAPSSPDGEIPAPSSPDGENPAPSSPDGESAIPSRLQPVYEISSVTIPHPRTGAEPCPGFHGNAPECPSSMVPCDGGRYCFVSFSSLRVGSGNVSFVDIRDGVSSKVARLIQPHLNQARDEVWTGFMVSTYMLPPKDFCPESSDALIVDSIQNPPAVLDGVRVWFRMGGQDECVEDRDSSGSGDALSA